MSWGRSRNLSKSLAPASTMTTTPPPTTRLITKMVTTTTPTTATIGKDHEMYANDWRQPDCS